MRTIVMAALIVGAALGLRANIDPKTFDSAVKPQDDFYRYVNGAWMTNTAIPPEESRWGSFNELRERNWGNVRRICEHVAATARPASEVERLVGDFYRSGMDEPAIEKAGLAPLQRELDQIAAIRSPAEVVNAIAQLKRIGVSAGFVFTAGIDAKNSAVNIAQLRQGGLSLPGSGVREADRDYYFREDDRSKELRARYVEHVEKILALAGDAPAAAEAGAHAVLRIETALAKVSRTRVALRDPQANYRKMTVGELGEIAPGVAWTAFFRATGAPDFEELTVAQPEFFSGFAALLAEGRIADWRHYLRWKLLHEAAPFLSAAFEAENFRFYSGIITGVTSQKPRWRRVAAVTDEYIGDALGQLYVAEYFPPAAKARVLKMVEDLKAALAERIQALDWMDAPTKEKALVKLNAFGLKMGYPETWKDYTSAEIDRGPYVANVFRAGAYEVRRNLAKIGRPVDKDEWTMTPPTVNARYSATLNDILFPAGILQPPFFDPRADDAVNYGAIGAVIGHEMSHGFDDSGRQYDAQGNLADWWSHESAEEFKARAAGIVRQFGGYTVLDGVPLNGELTQGENIADLGGLKIAFTGLQRALAGKPRPQLEGWTPEQRFFLSWASIWRELMRDAEQLRRVNVDPHAPGRWRVNGPLSNMDEFAQAFDVPERAPMRRPAAERVTIW